MNLDYLRKRAELLEATRSFFRERGFTEVETPVACDQVIPEAHIEPVRTEDRLFLQASPEMEMKRLLCSAQRDGGSGPIFQVCKAFRDESGPLHRPEFTMIEWYRPGDDMRAGMELLDEFVQAMLQTAPCKRTSYRDAFWRSWQVDPLNGDLRQLAEECERYGTATASELVKQPRDELLNVLMLKVEEELNGGEPTILYHYPASQAALAATATDALGVEVAERFELYYRGVELANGYHELTDAEELRRRLEETNDLRVADGRPALPLPEKLLADMVSPGLPACAGVALGFDRLVMLAVGAESIGEVVAE